MISLTVFLVIAIVAGFYMAWNIGANDVANAMGTPVGSGALTLRKAVILAGVFEFLGAFFVGSNVSTTIAKGIVPIEAFQQQAQTELAPGAEAGPAIGVPAEPSDTPDPASVRFAIGMLAALLAAAIWLNIATFFGQPVSTTHAIVGAVIGFAVVSVGPGAVQWDKMGKIAASWVISPLAGGLLAYLVYRGILRFVLKSRDPVHRAMAAVPLALGSVIFVLVLSILYKGLHMEVGARSALPAALGAALVAMIVARVVILRHTRRHRVQFATRYETIEKWFARIQILTACYIAFAHGANDVANAIGPLAAAIRGFTVGLREIKTLVPVWLLAFGGVGIVIGLGTYGYKVIESVGRKITEITPTRGFAAEFGTATTVLVCSKMGLPVSTTLVLVGAVMGVGIARGFGAIDLKVIKRIFMSWVITIPVSAALGAVLYWIMIALYGG